MCTIRADEPDLGQDALAHTLGPDHVFIDLYRLADLLTSRGGDDDLLEWLGPAACARRLTRPDGYGTYWRDSSAYEFYLEYDRGTTSRRDYYEKFTSYDQPVARRRFERCFPGVYRLSRAPTGQHDDLLQAVVWTNYRGAISHESALALYGLADVMPTHVHLTVPPDFRRTTSLYVLHRSALAPDEVTEYDGVRVTTPARSIADTAAAGMDPEQVVKAVQQAHYGPLAMLARRTCK